MLAANITPAKFEGFSVARGQVVSSIKHIAEENGLTQKEVRTAIKQLERSNTVAIQSTSKFTIFTICNYEKYQGWANERANKGQPEGKQRANRGQQYKKEKKENKNNSFDYSNLVICGGN